MNKRISGSMTLESLQYAALPGPRARSLWLDALIRFRRNKLAVLGAIFLIALGLAAVFASWITPAHYADIKYINEAYAFPSREHWMGVDALGRDFFSRIVYGARVSLAVSFAVMAVAVAIGLPLGALSGLIGGPIDWLVLRMMELFFPIPPFLLGILLMTVLGPGIQNVLIAIAITAWIPVCRLVRGQVLSLRERDFVIAARLFGAGPMHIMIRHLLPNSLAPVIVAVTLGIPSAIMSEAGLSFLGVGVSVPTPSWGQMICNGLIYINFYWHLAVIPAAMLAITMLAFSVTGDGLRDALDPMMRV